MNMINKKNLSEIQNEKQESDEAKLANIYEILIELDSRLSAIEEKLGMGGEA